MMWRDGKRVDRLAYELVDPFNMDFTRGWLEGVTECQLSYGYYTDTRWSGSITAVNPNYIENSLIRVHHFVDEYGYHAELGTFFVTEIQPTTTAGASVFVFTLESMLARVSEDEFTANYVIPAGRTAKQALADLFSRYAMDYRYEPSCPDMTYKSSVIYEVGESVLSALFDIASNMGARLSVDGHGVATLSRYVEPSLRTPTMAIDPLAGDSLVVGEISESTDFYSTPNRYIVSHKDGDVLVSGYADTPATVATSYSRRGRRVAEHESVDSLSNASNQAATAVAAANLARVEGVSHEVAFSSLYFPLEDGEVVSFGSGGEVMRLMIKSRDVTIAAGMSASNTFKEV